MHSIVLATWYDMFVVGVKALPLNSNHGDIHMTAVIRAKTWEQRREEKIAAEYVRLSEENRERRDSYLEAIEQIQELQIRLSEVLTGVES